MGLVAFHAVSEPPSRLHRVLKAVAVDVGLPRRRRGYRLLVRGQFVSLAGSELTFVAVPFQTFALTHSSPRCSSSTRCCPTPSSGSSTPARR
jgi:hypothetical protein